MKKYLFLPLTGFLFATLAAGCSIGSGDESAADKDRASQPDSVELQKIKLLEAARLDSIRQDSLRIEQQMCLVPFKFLGSDIRKSLTSIGFEDDYEANTEKDDLCLSRALFGRVITVRGNSYPGSKMYEIFFSDSNEKDAFIEEIKKMGFEQNGDIFYDNTSKSNDYFRIEPDRIVFGGPYLPQE